MGRSCFEGLEAPPYPPGTIGGVDAEPPALKKIYFFCKNNLILALFW